MEEKEPRLGEWHAPLSEAARGLMAYVFSLAAVGIVVAVPAVIVGGCIKKEARQTEERRQARVQAAEEFIGVGRTVKVVMVTSQLDRAALAVTLENPKGDRTLVVVAISDDKYPVPGDRWEVEPNDASVWTADPKTHVDLVRLVKRVE